MGFDAIIDANIAALTSKDSSMSASTDSSNTKSKVLSGMVGRTVRVGSIGVTTGSWWSIELVEWDID